MGKQKHSIDKALTEKSYILFSRSHLGAGLIGTALHNQITDNIQGVVHLRCYKKYVRGSTKDNNKIMLAAKERRKEKKK